MTSPALHAPAPMETAPACIEIAPASPEFSRTVSSPPCVTAIVSPLGATISAAASTGAGEPGAMDAASPGHDMAVSVSAAAPVVVPEIPPVPQSLDPPEDKPVV